MACDQYHRYEEDVALLADLGLTAYRFSVAWPRIQPAGEGPPNPAGLDHYRRLVDALRDRDVAPVATLFHWDLPQALEDLGGWPNRDTAERFAEYAAIVAGALGDHVAMWITQNEPWVASWMGYGSGVHAPGRTDDALALAASHHLLLAHGLAADAIRASAPGQVGIALNLQPARPATEAAGDVEAARLADLHMNAQYLDQIFGRGFPEDLARHYRAVSDLGFVREGDAAVIARPLDFLGVNYYTRHVVSADPEGQELPGHLGAWSIVPPDVEATAMGWVVDPQALTDILLRLRREYPALPIHVTENGAAYDDVVEEDGRVRDGRRVAYLRGHVEAVRAAVAAEVDVRGYFVWSLLDNFEWAEGYAKRFGIVHVDYETQRRRPKDSAMWIREQLGRPVTTGP